MTLYKGSVSVGTRFVAAFVASNAADRFRKQFVSRARAGRLGFLIAGGAFYIVTPGVAVADVAAGQHFARRTRRIIAVRRTTCLFTLAASFTAGFAVGFQRIPFGTRRCGRAVPRRAGRDVAVVASAVRSCNVCADRRITVGRVAAGFISHFTARFFHTAVADAFLRTAAVVIVQATGRVSGAGVVAGVIARTAGHGDATVVRATLIACALVVGSAVSRNRRTSHARAVRTADTRRGGRISRTARRSIAAVNRGTRFQRTAVAAAVGSRCSVSRVVVCAARCRITHLRARFRRTAVAAAVGAGFDVSRVFVAGTACSVSHLGTRFFRAAVACAVAAGFTRRVGVVVAAARRRVPHFSAALLLAGIACAVGSRLVRGNGVVVAAARRRIPHFRTAFQHALRSRQFIVVDARRARAGFARVHYGRTGRTRRRAGVALSVRHAQISALRACLQFAVCAGNQVVRSLTRLAIRRSRAFRAAVGTRIAVPVFFVQILRRGTRLHHALSPVVRGILVFDVARRAVRFRCAGLTPRYCFRARIAFVVCDVLPRRTRQNRTCRRFRFRIGADFVVRAVGVEIARYAFACAVRHLAVRTAALFARSARFARITAADFLARQRRTARFVVARAVRIMVVRRANRRFTRTFDFLFGRVARAQVFAHAHRAILVGRTILVFRAFCDRVFVRLYFALLACRRRKTRLVFPQAQASHSSL